MASLKMNLLNERERANLGDRLFHSSRASVSLIVRSVGGDAAFCLVLKDLLLKQDDFKICGELSLDLNAASQITAAKADIVILQIQNTDNFKFVDELKSW
jgi:hypothetical protein